MERAMGAKIACWMVLAVAWGAGCAVHPPPTPISAPLVVRFVDGSSGLTAEYVRDAIATLGPVQRAALANRAMFDAFLQDLASLHLLARQAEQGLPADDSILVQPLGLQRDRHLAAARIDAEVARRGPIPEADLHHFYDTHPEYFQGAAQVRIRQIVTHRRDVAEAAAARLEAGDPFESVARRYSIHPSAARGGEMGWHEEARLEPALREAVTTLVPGARSPVVESRFGYHIIEVEARRPAAAIPFERVRDRVERRLERERREVITRQLIEALRHQWQVTPQPEVADRLYHDLSVAPEGVPTQ